jgi:hypothetical protein
MDGGMDFGGDYGGDFGGGYGSDFGGDYGGDFGGGYGSDFGGDYGGNFDDGYGGDFGGDWGVDYRDDSGIGYIPKNFPDEWDANAADYEAYYYDSWSEDAVNEDIIYDTQYFSDPSTLDYMEPSLSLENTSPASDNNDEYYTEDLLITNSNQGLEKGEFDTAQMEISVSDTSTQRMEEAYSEVDKIETDINETFNLSNNDNSTIDQILVPDFTEETGDALSETSISNLDLGDEFEESNLVEDVTQNDQFADLVDNADLLEESENEFPVNLDEFEELFDEDNLTQELGEDDLEIDELVDIDVFEEGELLDNVEWAEDLDDEIIAEVELEEKPERNPVNSKYAGNTYFCEEGSDLAEKYPDGVDFTDDGYPDFSPYAIEAVEIDMKGNYTTDFKDANEAAGLEETPDGYTWHHSQDCRTMLLIPTDIHSKVGHTGGVSILRKTRLPECICQAKRGPFAN